MSASRSLVEDPDKTFEVSPDRCSRCADSLAEAAETARVRCQVVDVDSPPPPKVAEYPRCRRGVAGVGRSMTPRPPMCRVGRPRH